MTTSPRTVMRIYFHLHKPDEEMYEKLLALLEGITPRVQAHPADWSADVDLTGALRYWKRDAEGLAAVIRLRALALYGIQSSAGIGSSRMVAAMAAAVTPPGSVTAVGNSAYDIAAFLRPQRASALSGVGPATARALGRYGIHTVGDIADTQLATLQRILGTAAGRQAHDRAHGTDDRPVVPAAPPSRSAAPTDLIATNSTPTSITGPSSASPSRSAPSSGTSRGYAWPSRWSSPTPTAPTPPALGHSQNPPPTLQPSPTQDVNSSRVSDSNAPASAPSPCAPNTFNPPSTQSTSSLSTPATTRPMTSKPPSTVPVPDTAPASPALQPHTERGSGRVAHACGCPLVSAHGTRCQESLSSARRRSAGHPRSARRFPTAAGTSSLGARP